MPGSSPSKKRLDAKEGELYYTGAFDSGESGAFHDEELRKFLEKCLSAKVEYDRKIREEREANATQMKEIHDSVNNEIIPEAINIISGKSIYSVYVY